MTGKSVEYIGFPEQGRRLAYLDYLKIFAAFAVVMTHIASIGWQALPVEDSQWLISSVYEIVTRFCVPVFFMCSGAVLLNPCKTIPLKTLAVKYILRTTIIALGVSVAFVLLQNLLSGWGGFRALLRASIDGPYFIWYLWVLVGLYFLLPFLKPIAENQRLLTGLIAVLFVFVIGKNTLITMFPDSVLTVMANNFILFTENAEGLFYFLLGAYLVSHSFSRAARIAIYLAGAISLLCAIVLNYSDALLSGWDLYYVNRGNALIAVMSASVFVLFGRVFRNASLGRLSKWLVECGLMIYLIHPFVRQILESCDAFSWVVAFLLDNALLGIPLVTLAVYLVSLLVASFFKVGCNAARRLISR